jgi:hypothetical protein
MSGDELIVTSGQTDIALRTEAADQTAVQAAFIDCCSRKADNTLKRQDLRSRR